MTRKAGASSPIRANSLTRNGYKTSPPCDVGWRRGHAQSALPTCSSRSRTIWPSGKRQKSVGDYGFVWGEEIEPWHPRLKLSGTGHLKLNCTPLECPPFFWHSPPRLTPFRPPGCIFPCSCLPSSSRYPSTHKGDDMTKKELIDQVTSSSGGQPQQEGHRNATGGDLQHHRPGRLQREALRVPRLWHLHIARTSGTERTQSANRGHHQDQRQQDHCLQADAFPQRQPVIITTNTGARGPACPARRRVPLSQREHPHDSVRLEAPAGYLRGNKGSAKKCGCDLKVASHV